MLWILKLKGTVWGANQPSQDVLQKQSEYQYRFKGKVPDAWRLAEGEGRFCLFFERKADNWEEAEVAVVGRSFDAWVEYKIKIKVILEAN